jgi:hypothetical protein
LFFEKNIWGEEKRSSLARKEIKRLVSYPAGDVNTMNLYHGSTKKLSKLKRQQAWAPPGRPLEESLNAIYLTSDFAYALLHGAEPEGIADIDFRKRTVHFDNNDKFDPEQMVYIYIVDSTKIPVGKQKQINNQQVVADLDEIEPDRMEVHKAAEIYQYFKVI